MQSLRILTIVCVAAWTAAAKATETSSEYNATEAAQHVGETATVTDKVARVSVAKGGNVFLDLGGEDRKTPFTIFISAKLADQFPDVKNYQGKTISVTGKITTHKDRPEISVTEPSQIKVKENAESTEGSSPSPSPRK